MRSLSQHKSTSSLAGTSLNGDELKLYELALTAGFQMDFEVFKYACSADCKFDCLLDVLELKFVCLFALKGCFRFTKSQRHAQ